MSKYIKVDNVRDHLLSLANDFEKNDQYYPEKHLKEKAKTLRMLSEKFYDYPGNIEIKHGEWIYICDGLDFYAYECSVCHKDCDAQENSKYNFCPNCGADMRGKADE